MKVRARMGGGLFVLAALAALAAAVAGCSRDVPACKKTCQTELAGTAEKCDEMCTRSCDDLAKTYGLPVERCRWLQAGGKGDPPPAPGGH